MIALEEGSKQKQLDALGQIGGKAASPDLTEPYEIQPSHSIKRIRENRKLEKEPKPRCL